jgi:hypothetical protein
VLTIRALPGCTGLALIGDADLTVRDMLRAACATLVADSSGEIHLDLAGLRFIDVACTRELFAIIDRHPAMRLIVHHPPATLLRITDLVHLTARMEFSQAQCLCPPADDRQDVHPAELAMAAVPPPRCGHLLDPPPDGIRDSARSLLSSGKPNHRPANRQKTATGVITTETPLST